MGNEELQSGGVGPQVISPEPDLFRILPPVSKKQGKCLQFILSYFIENRYYPTQREVADAMGIKSSTVEHILQPLMQKGYLTREHKKQRNIRLTRDGIERLKLMGVTVESKPVAA
jgi:SOS-response transcriptional repressor LexA